MVFCKKCGTDNQLGRVFCTSCGAKLDLTNMSNELIADKSSDGSWISQNWGRLVSVPLVILVLAIAGLAFWPKAKAIGDKGSSASARKIEAQISSLTNLKPGKKFGPVAVSEADLNGYLEVLAKKAGLTSMSLDLSKGLMNVRAVKTFQQLDIRGKKYPIALSFEAKYVPEGGRLMVKQASIGHVKLFGPLMKVADSLLAKAIAAEPKNANLSVVEQLTIDDGKLSVIVSKK